LPKAEKEDPKLGSLVKLIGWLDGYRALSCVDPVRIESVVKGFPQHDLKTMWREVKTDIYKIASLPASSPEIVRMHKVLAISKILFLMLAIVAMTVWITATRVNPSFFGSMFGIILLALLAALYNATIIIYVVYNRRLYKKVRSYYEEHSKELGERRKRIKNATQQLIDKLARYIKGQGYEPEKYEFSLFHFDYDNIKIVGEKRKKHFAIVKT
jgi:hypothetical protein